MKLARLVVLAVALLATGSVVAEAQGGPPRGGGRAMNPTPMLLENITLTADQQVEVDMISARYTAEMAAFREKMQAGGGDMQAAREEMQKMRTKLQTELRAVLTAEQQSVFDRNVEAMAQRQQRRPPPGGGR